MRRWEVVGEFVRKNQWTRGAEIGVWKGQTFFYLLDRFPELEMIGVDSWESGLKREKDIQLGISTWKSPQEMEANENYVKTRAKAYDRAFIYHMDSLRAATLVENGSLDFVFIDANHDEQAVINDILTWRFKVKDDGYLLGHDEQWPSVRRALKSLFREWEAHDDNVWSVAMTSLP